MNRPYIICHMVTSIDGKVTGDFLKSSACEKACELYYEINRNLKSNGFICGRVTMEESFTNGWYPNLDSYRPQPKTDYIPKGLSGFYAVAFDTYGKLGWKAAKIIDPDGDPGYDGAQVIEILSEQVDARYLGYLRAMGIPYLFAGKEKIDVQLALEKLKECIGAETLLLEGGSIINGAFLKAEAIDALSLVVAPVVADQADRPLFDQSRTEAFRLTESLVQGETMVLNYRKSEL